MPAYGAPAQPTSCGCAIVIMIVIFLILTLFVIFGYFALRDFNSYFGW